MTKAKPKAKRRTKPQLTDLLLKTQRVSGTRKPITIVNPERYDDFFVWLKDSHIRLHTQALIAVLLSGGLRVSEALALRKRDFDLAEGFFRVRVLKKKKKLERTRIVDGKEETYYLATHKVYRDAKLHPIAAEIVKEFLELHAVKYHERLFPIERNAAYKQIRKIFGANSCPHMMRHSHASWLLNVKQAPLMTAADIMKVTPDKLASYNHTDARSALTKLYGGN